MHDRVLAWLEEEVPPSRIRHILGVEAMAEELAEIYESIAPRLPKQD